MTKVVLLKTTPSSHRHQASSFVVIGCPLAVETAQNNPTCVVYVPDLKSITANAPSCSVCQSPSVFFSLFIYLINTPFFVIGRAVVTWGTPHLHGNGTSTKTLLNSGRRWRKRRSCRNEFLLTTWTRTPPSGSPRWTHTWTWTCVRGKRAFCGNVSTCRIVSVCTGTYGFG